jgi:signal transduction histidine kinase
VLRVDLMVTAGLASITVDDDGPGIDEADRERVFEPFYRGDGALRRTPGNGLGLALVRHIAESHGGSACFRPRGGPGARLQVSLPEMKG